MSSIPNLSLGSLLGNLSFSLTPHILLTILISARSSATSFSFLTGQVSLPCNILLCTQLLYSLQPSSRWSAASSKKLSQHNSKICTMISKANILGTRRKAQTLKLSYTLLQLRRLNKGYSQPAERRWVCCHPVLSSAAGCGRPWTPVTTSHDTTTNNTNGLFTNTSEHICFFTFQFFLSLNSRFPGYYLLIHFAIAAVAVDSSHMAASSSASWCSFSPPSNFVNGHMSTMWFNSAVDHRSQQPVLCPLHNCVNRCHVWP